jgi:glycosyltransferase involved in cell wall biosynthesis
MSFSKIKLVFTEHSTSNRRRNSIVFQIIDQFIYSFYTKIITISDDVDLAIKKSIKSNLNKFILIKNGINLKLIESGKVYNDAIFEKKGNKKFLIQVSSFQYPKDQKTLIKSLLHLPSKFSLFLVGDGILRTECEGLVDTLNLQSRVHFLGIRMDIANLLQTADFIVLSSHHEGLSLASIEGLASGKPFIASDVPGLHEVVNGAGLLFEDGDYKALAQHILQLDTNLDFYNQTVKNCLERAAEFNIEIMVKKEIELYKTLIQ